MAKILISGTTGFVGGHLSKVLSNTYEVIPVNRKKGYGIQWQDLDDLTDDVFAIIHCAGLAHDASKNADNSAYEAANVKTTEKLIELANRLQIPKFIYLSTIKVYGDEAKIEENSVPNPSGVYGQSKLAAEMLVSSTLNLTSEAIRLRPCMVYGPGSKGNLNRLLAFLKKGFPYPFYKRDFSRTMVSLHNLTAVVNEILKSTIPSGAYNLADDQGLTTSEIIDLYESTNGIKIRKFPLPKMMMPLLSWIPAVQKMTGALHVSNAQLLRALHWSTMPQSAQDSMMKTLKEMDL